MKRNTPILWLLLCLFAAWPASNLHSQVQINTDIFGQNAWYMDYDQSNNGGDPSDALANSVWAKAAASGVKFVRVGGIEANYNPPYTWNASTGYSVNVSQLIAIIDKIRLHGMEPIIQVGFDPVIVNNAPNPPPNECPSTSGRLIGISRTNQAIIAGNVVQAIKNHYGNNSPIYWIIANEPNLPISCNTNDRQGFGYNNHPGDVPNYTAYIKEFAEQMKTADPNIEIIGPEITGFTTDDYAAINKIMQDLLSHPSNTNSVLGTIPSLPNEHYIDIVSFHTYPDVFGRPDAVASPTDMVDGFKGKILANDATNHKKGLITMLSGSGRDVTNISVALTEFNIERENNPEDEASSSGYYNMIKGSSNRSFIGGQWMAEMYCVGMGATPYPGNPANPSPGWVKFMTAWSIQEGNDCFDTYGYISNCSANQDLERPSYWHYSMVANNFSGAFYANVASPMAEHKAYAYMNSTEIGVLIMNQVETQPNIPVLDHDFTIRFDGVAPSGTFPISFAMGVSGTYSCRIKTETTALLKFDLQGNLISRTEYSIDDALNKQGPKTWSNGNGSANAFIKDVPWDSGLEPYHGNPWDLPFSDDIWVRNYNNYGTVTNGVYTGGPHENPEYPSSQSQAPHIYVKVNNTNCPTASVSGVVEVYYNNTSTSDIWSSSWASAGTSQMITIPAGGTYVVEIPWTALANQPIPPASGQNYCLLARFVSSEDPMFLSRTNVSSGEEIKYNNNIAQKNIIVYDAFPSPILVGNPGLLAPVVTSIKFFSNTKDPLIPKDGTMKIELDPLLYAKWVAGGKQGTGISEVPNKCHLTLPGTVCLHNHILPDNTPIPNGSSTLMVTSMPASIDNITLGPNEMHKIFVKYNFYASLTSPSPYFEHDIRQFSNGTYTGAVRMQVTPPACDAPVASGDQLVGSGCPATLTASPFEQGAEYNWYNAQTGVLVGTGDTITVYPEQTTIYELEMISPNGCIGYDYIEVIVNDFSCTLLGNRLAAQQEQGKQADLNMVPNPASDKATLFYSLGENAAEGEIQILNVHGKLIASHKVYVDSDRIDLDLSSLASGIYYSSLIVNGQAVMTIKTVITK